MKFMLVPSVLCTLLLSPCVAYADDPPPPSVSQPSGINLGKTSFYDGFSGPYGWNYLAYLTHGVANTFRDQRGNRNAAFDDPKLLATTLLNQVSYTSPNALGNSHAHLGWSIIVPLVSLDASFGSSGAQLVDNGTGLGDITIGPQVQFDPLLDGSGRPVYVQRFALDFMLPTGKYDADKDLNPGTNALTINPYWAASWMPVPRWELSWRLNYIHNSKNTDPASSSPSYYRGEVVRDTQAGHSMWLNFAGSHEVRPGLSVGLNGYFFKQIGDDKVNGEQLADSREQVLGIGPGVFWQVHKGLDVWFNTYHETKVENRSQNDLIVQVRLAHAF